MNYYLLSIPMSVVLLISGFCFPLSAVTLMYRETTGKLVRTAPTTITTAGDSIVVESVSPAYTIRYVVEKDLSGRSWSVKNTENDFEFDVRKTGPTIDVKGRLKNKPIVKTLTPKNRVWYQEQSLPLGAWVKSGRKKLSFWSVMVFNGELFEFEATNEGTQTITVDTLAIACIHVRMNLAGAMAMLWRGDYWFRATDGRLIKFEGANRPGAPKTTYELVEEKQL